MIRILLQEPDGHYVKILSTTNHADNVDSWLKIVIGCLALLTAILSVGAFFLAGAFLEQRLGKKGLNILSKVSGLILAAIASQMIFTGIQSFLK